MSEPLLLDYRDDLYGSLDYDYGYGHHSGNDRHSDYGGVGSHSESGYGGGKEECCALVVDFLCLAILVAAIGGAAFLLSQV